MNHQAHHRHTRQQWHGQLLRLFTPAAAKPKRITGRAESTFTAHFEGQSLKVKALTRSEARAKIKAALGLPATLPLPRDCTLFKAA